MRFAIWARPAVILILFTGGAEAMPLSATYHAASMVTLVADGCGGGFHRDAVGACVPNLGGGGGWGGGGWHGGWHGGSWHGSWHGGHGGWHGGGHWHGGDHGHGGHGHGGHGHGGHRR
jgi:hypothetical protein